MGKFCLHQLSVIVYKWSVRCEPVVVLGATEFVVDATAKRTLRFSTGPVPANGGR